MKTPDRLSPLPPGVDPQSRYGQAWPGRPGIFKLNERVVLEIPPQFQKFWLQRDWAGREKVQRPPVDLAEMPLQPTIGFVMHLPSFEGYTPANYEVDFDASRVEIVDVRPASMAAIEPGAAGAFPPNAFERFLRYSGVDPSRYEERYGLRCYREPADDTRRTCYGRRDAASDEYLILETTEPPYSAATAYPLMRTAYFTPRYGGLEVAWRSHMNNFAHWQDIDRQIWKYIDAWNIARPAAANHPASSTRPR